MKKYKVETKEVKGIIQAGFPDAPYYTNSTQLPADFGEDVFSALDLQDDLQKTYTGGCVEAGNYVITNKGAILIEDIVSSFTKEHDLKVVSYNKETGASEWDEVVDAVKIDVSKHDKINIKAKGGINITTSDWHPFFVVNEDGSVVEKRADEVQEGDWLLCNRGNMFSEKETALPTEIAYMFGYFLGDGSLSRYEDNRGGNHLTKYKVRFFDSDEEQLKRIVGILRTFELSNANVIKNDIRSEVLREVSTSNKAAIELFFRYGFTSGNKTYTAHITDEIKDELNRANAFALLSGLIDSDGHICKRDGDMEYMTASYQLACDLVWLCTMLGIKTSFRTKHDKRYTNAHFTVSIGHREMARISNELSTTKKVINVYENKPYHRKLDERFNISLVTDVSKTEVEDNDFYDLTTKKNHNYLCGKEKFVFIHNTVFHIYSDEDVTGEQVKNVIRKVLSNYRLPYVSYTASFSTCPKHGRIPGLHEYCPLCDQEILAKHFEEYDPSKA